MARSDEELFAGSRASPPCRARMRGWFRDPAVWAWVVVGLLALLPLKSAFAQLARAMPEPDESALIGSQQRLMKVAHKHPWGSARADHLTELFLERGCKRSN